MANTILVIDDDQNMRWVLQRSLGQSGYEVIMAVSGEAGLVALAQHEIDVVLLDLKMPGMDGLGALRRIRQLKPDLPVILLTAYASVPTAVEAMRLGATEYLRKPFDIEEVRFALAKALERRQMAQQLQRLSSEVNALYQFSQVIGHSVAMSDLRERMKSAADSDLNVLVLGEKGTGKTFIAKCIIHASFPDDATHTEIQCKLLSERAIRKEMANPGEWTKESAILIDDIDLMSPQLQQELANTLSIAGLRIFATATVEDKVEPTLLERTADVIVRIPPLRERLDDIQLLTSHFLGQEQGLAPEALRMMQGYDWPGNVAELRSVLLSASALTHGTLHASNLPGHIAHSINSNDEPRFKLPPEGISLEEVEKQLLTQALEASHGNKTRAAELLGLTRHTLLYRMEKHGLM